MPPAMPPRIPPPVLNSSWDTGLTFVPSDYYAPDTGMGRACFQWVSVNLAVLPVNINSEWLLELFNSCILISSEEDIPAGGLPAASPF